MSALLPSHPSQLRRVPLAATDDDDADFGIPSENDFVFPSATSLLMSFTRVHPPRSPPSCYNQGALLQAVTAKAVAMAVTAGLGVRGYTYYYTLNVPLPSVMTPSNASLTCSHSLFYTPINTHRPPLRLLRQNGSLPLLLRRRRRMAEAIPNGIWSPWCGWPMRFSPRIWPHRPRDAFLAPPAVPATVPLDRHINSSATRNPKQGGGAGYAKICVGARWGMQPLTRCRGDGLSVGGAVGQAGPYTGTNEVGDSAGARLDSWGRAGRYCASLRQEHWEAHLFPHQLWCGRRSFTSGEKAAARLGGSCRRRLGVDPD
ncbi:hypothetical protein C8R46DRAFT_1188262 [Mycena filopes]|nr:hypothetical protein C8R46DRAFT_1188262 [Mycena filopes]